MSENLPVLKASELKRLAAVLPDDMPVILQIDPSAVAMPAEYKGEFRYVSFVRIERGMLEFGDGDYDYLPLACEECGSWSIGDLLHKPGCSLQPELKPGSVAQQIMDDENLRPR